MDRQHKPRWRYTNPNTLREPSWWHKWTLKERILLLLIICSTIVAITLIATLCTGCKNNLQDEEKMCMTPGCIHAAAKFLTNMDEDVEPCDDFFRFSCGNFLRDTNIRNDKSSADSFSSLQDNLQYQLRVILEEPIKSDELKPFKLAKKLYKGCMNKKLTQSRGTQPLLKVLNSFGGWPVLVGPNWDDSAFTWQKAVKDFRKKGYVIDHFIDFGVTNDFIDSFKQIIMMDQASLGLTREYLIKGLEDRVVTAYYKYMVDIAVLSGAPRGRAAVELKDSLLFEISLANISAPNEERRNMTTLYNPRTIAELQTEYPSISWLEYINDLLPAGLRVTRDEVVIITSPTYLKDLETLLKNTPKRVLANYVLWRITSGTVFYLTEDFRKRQLEFTSAVIGITEKEANWKECVSTVHKHFHIAVGSLYVQKYFNEDAKKIALEMVNSIRAEFINILENVDWMDKNTKKHALEKARAMTSYIAYPDEILDHNKLEEYYKGLEVDENQFMESVLNIAVFKTDYDFNKLRKPVNKSDWVNHANPAVVNAYYAPQENSIKFPAGILQGLFFSADRPKYMNYGAIGATIGHEITHGFDDQGRQFDKDGNLVDWWDSATKDAYLKKAQCIIEQYGNYTAKEINQNLNGINTQGENIADNGGIKEAYLAYTKWVETNGEEQHLPGLKYTPRQLFWISAGNTWCTKYRPETLKLHILIGGHSPAEFRILGPLSNMEDFAKDFQCPAGSPMNPHHKCKVW